MIQEMKKPKIPKSVKSPDYSFTHTSQDVIDEYEKTKSRKIIYEKYPEYIAADTLDPINMDPDAYKVVYTVRVRLIKRTIGINYNCPLNNLIDIQENFVNCWNQGISII